MLTCVPVKRFLRFWLVLAVAYPVIALAISWIVSGSIVYPAEMLAHIAIVPFLQAALLALLFRRPENPSSRS
jgi:hypothetical protein